MNSCLSGPRKKVTEEAPEPRQEKAPAKRGRRRQTAGEAFVKSVSREVGRQFGRQLVRGIMGSLFKGR